MGVSLMPKEETETQGDNETLKLTLCETSQNEPLNNRSRKAK